MSSENHIARSGRTGRETFMPNDHAILESISDGVFTVDPDFRITYLNASAESIIGIKRSEALDKLCCDVFRSSLCEGACALRRTLEAGKPTVDLACFIIDNRGRKIPISISTAVLRDNTGKTVGGAETFRNLSDLEKLKDQLRAEHKLGDFVSRSPAMARIFSRLEAVAESGATVLITGETGSGKELLARTIHAHSPRRNSPFVALNCGAFPETLLESELFGYKKGAFTGADRDKPGRFALVGDGTLFLDEIGEISPAMQVRLLRVLQERTYEPLGAVRSVKTAARILAATNRDLEKMVKEGTFRQDLYYRVNIIRLDLPPLRERREDIPFLIQSFIRKFNLRMKRSVAGVTASALKKLLRFDWPGNIRELENVIERAMVFCTKAVIDADDLPELAAGPATWTDAGTRMSSPGAPCSMRSTVNASELAAIRAALAASSGNRREAARLLGIDHTTFYRKLKRLNFAPELPDGRRKRR